MSDCRVLRIARRDAVDVAGSTIREMPPTHRPCSYDAHSESKGAAVSNQNKLKRPIVERPEIRRVLADERCELFDAVVTAAALVARADGRIEQCERYMIVDYLDRSGFMPAFTHREIVDAFERNLRQIDQYGGAEAAIDSLEKFAGRSPARLVIDAGNQVAIADGYLHEREIYFLQHIHIALGAPSPRGRVCLDHEQ
jgi:tellurite resistance protein